MDMEILNKRVEKCHKSLSSGMKSWLKDKRGLSEQIIEQFKLGCNDKSLTIPIYNKEGKYAFLKYRRDPFSKDENTECPKYWYSKDSYAELYGWEHITNPKPTLIICEGELDRLILETYGLHAITSTSGAGTFKDEWVAETSGIMSEIFICYDNDKTGEEWSQKLAERMPNAKLVSLSVQDCVIR